MMDYYGHKLSNGVLFAHHLILDVPGGSSHLGYRRRVPPVSIVPGTLGRCPGFARFTFTKISLLELSAVPYGDSATGVGELVSIGGDCPL